jgi:eukaryotic-like serine/threonine-protein kinase
MTTYARAKQHGPAALASRYRSLFVIGRGGMGSVEAALEIEPPGSKPDLAGEGASARAYERVVALKRLLPDAARDKRRVDMFLREARLAAMLDHPNIVRAYDFGELDGELYLAMEYVEGQPLSRVLRALADAGKRLSPAVVAYVLAEVCRGLHAAHELTDPTTKQPLNLVHRDVSPQNVMLGYDGRVRLLDFGVAKIETENVTKTGEVKGKTAYMSPEQAMGEPLDRRSDLFGLGAIFFECLALRRMWGDGTDMEVIRRLALEEPPKLEECGVDVPSAMKELHARLIARHAKDRPADAREVADTLRAFVPNAESASKELREILDAHFTEQAREQRARLSTSLSAVAPTQADELRESILPSHATKPVNIRVLKSVAAAKAAEPTPASSKESRTAGLVVLGIVVAALIAWRMVGQPENTAPTSTTPVPTTVVTGSATLATSLTPAPVPIEETTAPTPSATEPTTSATANASARPSSTSRVVPPTVRTTTATPRPPPAPPASKPPDIDDHPF